LDLINSADLGNSSKYSKEKTLKTEVGKGSMRTEIGHWLDDPKGEAYGYKDLFLEWPQKGIRLIFLIY